jgi:hypothetical protein
MTRCHALWRIAGVIHNRLYNAFMLGNSDDFLMLLKNDKCTSMQCTCRITRRNSCKKQERMRKRRSKHTPERAAEALLASAKISSCDESLDMHMQGGVASGQDKD